MAEALGHTFYMEPGRFGSPTSSDSFAVAWLVESEKDLPATPHDTNDKKAMKAWSKQITALGQPNDCNMQLKVIQKTFKFDYMEVQEKKHLDVKVSWLPDLCRTTIKRTI